MNKPITITCPSCSIESTHMVPGSPCTVENAAKTSLRPYVRHKLWCEKGERINGQNISPCNCGLDQALGEN